MVRGSQGSCLDRFSLGHCFTLHLATIYFFNGLPIDRKTDGSVGKYLLLLLLIIVVWYLLATSLAPTSYISPPDAYSSGLASSAHGVPKVGVAHIF